MELEVRSKDFPIIALLSNRKEAILVPVMCHTETHMSRFSSDWWSNWMDGWADWQIERRKAGCEDQQGEFQNNWNIIQDTACTHDYLHIHRDREKSWDMKIWRFTSHVAVKIPRNSQQAAWYTWRSLLAAPLLSRPLTEHSISADHNRDGRLLHSHHTSTHSYTYIHTHVQHLGAKRSYNAMFRGLPSPQQPNRVPQNPCQYVIYSGLALLTHYYPC